MIKYVDTKVTFAEVPDEISLCINISNCPCHCDECHSSYLAENIGLPLTFDEIVKLCSLNNGITCITLMGGDNNPLEVNILAEEIKQSGMQLKIAWYSGKQELSSKINLTNFDFIKLGPYKKNLGGLDSISTNQVFYKVQHPENILIDQTFKFKKQ